MLHHNFRGSLLGSQQSQNITTLDNVERIVELSIVSCSALGCILVLLSILLFRKLRWAIQRFIFALILAVLINDIMDFYPQPPFHDYSVDSYCWLSVLFQSSRFTLLVIELGILLVSHYALRHQVHWGPLFETLWHTAAWTIGASVGLVTLLLCQNDLKSYYGNVEKDPKIDGLFNVLTYLWLGAVVVEFFLFVLVNLEERHQKSKWVFEFDPFTESRAVRAFRTRLITCQKQAIGEILVPLRWFPLIFIVCACGEAGLVYYRLECENSSSATCSFLYFIFLIFIDSRGILNALIYFKDPDNRDIFRLKKLKGLFFRKPKRNVRFSRLPKKNRQRPSAYDPPVILSDDSTEEEKTPLLEEGFVWDEEKTDDESNSSRTNSPNNLEATLASHEQGEDDLSVGEDEEEGTPLPRELVAINSSPPRDEISFT